MTRKPAKLTESGSEFWDQVTGAYDLRPDEKRVLADACKTMATIDRLEAEADEGETYLTGSMGQQVLNGIFGELRQQRATLSRLLAQLKLPDLASDGSSAGRQKDASSEAGRSLVALRWGN